MPCPTPKPDHFRPRRGARYPRNQTERRSPLSLFPEGEPKKKKKKATRTAEQRSTGNSKTEKNRNWPLHSSQISLTRRRRRRKWSRHGGRQAVDVDSVDRALEPQQERRRRRRRGEQFLSARPRGRRQVSPELPEFLHSQGDSPRFFSWGILPFLIVGRSIRFAWSQ